MNGVASHNSFNMVDYGHQTPATLISTINLCVCVGGRGGGGGS